MNEKTRFVVVRHGDYVLNGLSVLGKSQMVRLAEQIRNVNFNQQLPMKLICSTASRAVEGGEILMRELMISKKDAVFVECLWEDSSHWSKSGEVVQLMEDNLLDSILLIGISHLDLVPQLAGYVAEKFGHNTYIGNSNYAEGWIVDKGGCRRFP